MNQPDRVELGPLQVSRLCLGTMLMGGKTPTAEAHRMLDAFVDAGHNFIDTADVYGDGAAEEVLKPWLARRRDDVVVTTKVRFPVSDPGGAGLAPERIRSACDASLRRMGIDEIDLYQVHAPDPDVELEDTLEALDGLVRARQGPRARALELPRVAARVGRAHAGLRGLGALRRPPSPILARRAVGRARSAPVLPRDRPRHDALGTARRRLLHRTAPARLDAGSGEPPRRGARRRRGGDAPASDRAELQCPRRGAGCRGGMWRDGAAGRHRVAVAPAGGRLAGARPANRRAARGPPAGSFAGPLPAPAAPARRHTQPPETYPHRMLAEQRGDRPEPALRRARPRVDARL